MSVCGKTGKKMVGQIDWDDFMRMGESEQVRVQPNLVIDFPEPKPKHPKEFCTSSRSRVLKELVGVSNGLTVNYDAGKFKMARLTLLLPKWATVDLVTNQLLQQQLSETWTIISSDPKVTVDAGTCLGKASDYVSKSIDDLARGTWIQYCTRAVEKDTYFDFAIFPLPRSVDGSLHLLVKKESIRCGTTKMKMSISLASIESSDFLPFLGRAPAIEFIQSRSCDCYTTETVMPPETQSREYKEIGGRAMEISADNILKALDKYLFSLVRGNSENFSLFLGVNDKTRKLTALPLKETRSEDDELICSTADVSAIMDELRNSIRNIWEGNIFPGVPPQTKLQIFFHEVVSPVATPEKVADDASTESPPERFIVEIQYCWPES